MSDDKVRDSDSLSVVCNPWLLHVLSVCVLLVVPRVS